MREEHLFHLAEGYRAPGLRIVSSSENQPGAVPSSGGLCAFCRVLPGVPRSRTDSRSWIIWLVFLHIGVYTVHPQLFAEVCKRHVHSLSLHQLIKSYEIRLHDLKSSTEGKRLNLLFHCLVKEEPERIIGWRDVLFLQDGQGVRRAPQATSHASDQESAGIPLGHPGNTG